jgi:hypothetical protein
MRNEKRMAVLLSAVVLLFAVGAAAVTKGSISINVANPMSVGGKQIDPGDLRITWVRTSPEAKVSFASRGKLVVEAQGKFVTRDTKSGRDTMVMEPGANGGYILKEIRFQGKKEVLVFE